MTVKRHSGAALGALFLLGLASCQDSQVTAPTEEARPNMPFAILDGSTTGPQDFFFLPPIVPNAPTLDGVFNPDLAPSIRICELDGGPVTTSICRRTIDEFPSGSIEVRENSYFLDWDPRNLGIRSSRYYRVEVIVADSVFGYVDLDPMGNEDGSDLSGSETETYAFGFRPRSSSVPIEFFLSVDAFCSGDVYVTECVTGVAVNQAGATITLDNAGNRLGVIIDQNSLPAPFEEILITLERIDPDAYLGAEDEECIPGLDALGTITESFDAPQFGDCFRVETIPELNDPLAVAAVVSICLDVNQLNLTQQQREQLRMVKFSDRNEDWTALQETAGNCPAQQASLFSVPDQGFMRYAAMGMNALASLVMPEPVAAGTIRFGGFNSSFSRFRFALPGEMVPTEGDEVIIQAADDNTINATITVLDAGDVSGENRQPVAGARVRFTPDAGAGTVSVAEVITGETGQATVEWTVDRTEPGDKILTASALGLFGGPVPDPEGVAYDLIAESVTFTATIVGPPAELSQDPANNIDDAVAGEPQPLSVTVTDADGNLVDGAQVTWTCTPICTFGEGTQNEDGSATITAPSDEGVATVQWTPLTSGSQVSVAGVDYDVPDVTFTATVSPNNAVEPTYPTVPETGIAGETLEELSLQVTDAFGNPREGDVVTWTVVTGDGFVSVASTTTDSDGRVSTLWTLGETAGPNELTIALGDFSATLSVEGGPAPPVQPIGQGSGQGGEVATALGTPLSFVLVDTFGNAIAEQVVEWTGDGSFDPASGVTNADGIASTIWTLGEDAGAQAAAAAVAGFTVDYTATADHGPAAKVSGGPETQSGTAGAALASALTVTVLDQFDNPVDGQTVTWSTPSANEGFVAGSFSAAATTTDVYGNASTIWTLGTEAIAQEATATIGDDLTVTYGATAAPDEPANVATSGGGVTLVVGSGTTLSVTVTDQYGNLVEGATATWSGGGTYSSTTTTTDANGASSVFWAPPTRPAGANTGTVTVNGVGGTYSVTTTPDIAANIVGTGGGGEYAPGTEIPLGITVTDQYLNPIDPTAITWFTSYGSVTGDGFTGAGGTGSGAWTLPAVQGIYSATATVGDVTATFSASVICSVEVDGQIDPGEWNCALEDETFRTFTANVDGGVDAEVRWQQSANSLYFLIRVAQDPLDRVNEVRIDFDNTGDGASPDDDAIGFSATDGGFYDEYLSERCVNRGQSGCGDVDTNGKDGAGATGAQDGWTVYELSHPLAGDGVQDFNVTSGDVLKFFLTFQNGNGAKGNTQFPGFREYIDITIR